MAEPEELKGLTLPINKIKKTTNLLEESKRFEKEIRVARTTLGIPKEGFQYKNKYSLKNLKWNHQFTRDKIRFHADKICKKFNLSDRWRDSIIWLIALNILLPPMNSDPLWIIPKIEEGELLYLHPERLLEIYKRHYVFLILQERISKYKLHKLIDKHWSKIKDGLDSFPKQLTNKMHREEIAKKILYLRDDKNLSFNDIADILQKDYTDRTTYDILNVDNIRQLYHRYKKKISEI